MSTEIWRPIPSFPAYSASSHGRVRSSRGVLSPSRRDTGHLQVSLRQDGQSRSKTVGVLVCEAFHGPRPAGLKVLHRNGNPADNTPANVHYGTQQENVEDSVRHGTHPHARKTHCPKGHAYDARSKRGRVCRECGREAQRRYRARRHSSLNSRS